MKTRSFGALYANDECVLWRIGRRFCRIRRVDGVWFGVLEMCPGTTVSSNSNNKSVI